MRLIQVCNVGNVVGGTAACAWSVTRALPEVTHTVVFRSAPTAETKRAFAHCCIEVATKIEPDFLDRLGGDLLMLHNISAQHVFWDGDLARVKMPVLQYVHSAFRGHAKSDLMVACSQYLSQKMGQPELQVVYQGVPKPKDANGKRERCSSKELIVGRICTPCRQKWPGWLVPFYQRMAERFPEIRWEFVGCPEAMQSDFSRACHQQAVFYEASWEARKYMNRWHVLLYHNRDITETFGRTVAEAMLAGCVPVVDNAGGFCEQIDSTNGFLCNEPDDFINALEVVADREEWERRSKACQDSAEACFSLRVFRERLLRACLLAVENSVCATNVKS